MFELNGYPIEHRTKINPVHVKQIPQLYKHRIHCKGMSETVYIKGVKNVYRIEGDECYSFYISNH